MYTVETSYYPYLGLLLLLCSSCAALAQFLRPTDLKWSLGTRRLAMPPGPLGVPVLGNLPQMMRARRGALSFNKWLASLIPYGDMVTLHMGSRTWVVLNSDRVVSEIIAKRGKITNERPHMPVASDLVSNGKRTVIRQEEDWREGRRVMHQLLSGSNLKVYAGMQELESVDLLRRYLREPDMWFAHNYRYATSVLYRVVMGYPLNKTRAQLDDYQRVTMEFVTAINRSYVRFAGDDEEAMYLATSVMAAGGDNTRMTINVFVMAMVTRPEAQARAREEIERVCNDGASLRLPQMSDLPAMPYVAAMIKEVLRWRPTVPVVPPHQLTEDLAFDGYVIPAGTCFLINSIGLSREFDDAHEFRPERWIDSEGAGKIPNFWGFGGGRRICVGWKVAEQALFVAFSRLLYCFELRPNGPIDDEILNHQALHEPFPVKAVVRSAAHSSLIEEEASKYESSFSTFGAK
ncbi:hypothetical protein VdG1_04177 [Verticillium dahliae VDG1]|nr:hypothetical protein VdG1_04177 [Verticillium dahliae VDG1]